MTPQASRVACLLVCGLLAGCRLSFELPAGKPPAGPAVLKAAPFCAADRLPHPPLKHGRWEGAPLPAVEKPAKGRWFLDPQFGSCMVRVTDHLQEPPEGFARNDYSRRQPFNADGRRLLVYARDGRWHLYDARDFTYLKPLKLAGNAIEPYWDPADPDVLYVIPNKGGMILSRYNVEKDTLETAIDFREPMPLAGREKTASVTNLWPRAARLSTHGEGSPSKDGRYWAFQVETEDFQPLGLIAFDLERKRIAGYYDLTVPGRDIGPPNHVSMSPEGRHVVASWSGEGMDCTGALGSLDKPCGLMAFSRNFTRARGLAARGPHSDLALTEDGREVIVISNYASGRVEMIDLASGETTPLWDIYIGGHATAMHISGKAYARPGWVLVSTYAHRGPSGKPPWYVNRIMAVELAAEPRIVNIAHTWNRGESYFSEPHAAANPDLTRVVFNSNWGSGRDGDVDVYLVRLPPASLAD